MGLPWWLAVREGMGYSNIATDITCLQKIGRSVACRYGYELTYATSAHDVRRSWSAWRPRRFRVARLRRWRQWQRVILQPQLPRRKQAAGPAAGELAGSCHLRVDQAVHNSLSRPEVPPDGPPAGAWLR